MLRRRVLLKTTETEVMITKFIIAFIVVCLSPK